MNFAVYLDGYAKNEAESLASASITVAQISSTTLDALQETISSGARFFMRGPKLIPHEYAQLATRIKKFGYTQTTTPVQYEFLSDSTLYERAIAEFVPPKRVFEITRNAELYLELQRLNEWRKLFIRSELGSAAKFSGLEACIIEEFTSEEVSQKVGLLVSAFPDAKRLIARRVESVRKIKGQNAEGRFLVIDGQLAHLDHCELLDGKEASEFAERTTPHAELVTRAFAAKGIGGDYFIDIAETADGGWFVVEIKPAFNGTIRDIGKLIRSLKLS